MEIENIVDTIINEQCQVNILKNHFNKEINLTKDYTVWNSLPKRIASLINKRSLQTKNSNTSRSVKATEDCIKILNYTGETAERMVKSCVKKLCKSFK